MKTPLNGSTPHAVRNLAAMTMLVMLTGCACEHLTGDPGAGGKSGPRTRDFIKIIPNNSPGPHPKTLILVASDHSTIDASAATITQGKNPNGTANPYWVVIEVQTSEKIHPTATVSPQP